MAAERVDWIDAAKGFAILAVIVGHTLGYAVGGAAESAVRAVIYSFHMPLFFMVSAITFRFSETMAQFLQKTKRAARHLLVPMAVVYSLGIFAYNVGRVAWSEVLPLLKEAALCLLDFTRIIYVPTEYVPPAVCIVWFLLVLFLGRTLFDLLHLVLPRVGFYVALCVATAVGVACGYFGIHLPFCLDIACVVMPFFFAGYLTKRLDMGQKTWLRLGLCVAVWVVCLGLCVLVGHTYLELASRRYVLFPVSFVGAIAATLALGYVGHLISKWRAVKPLLYVGKNSLYLLEVHILDYFIEPLWALTGNGFVDGALRTAEDILLFLVLMQVLGAWKRRKAKRAAAKAADSAL